MNVSFSLNKSQKRKVIKTRKEGLKGLSHLPRSHNYQVDDWDLNPEPRHVLMMPYCLSRVAPV